MRRRSLAVHVMLVLLHFIRGFVAAPLLITYGLMVTAIVLMLVVLLTGALVAKGLAISIRWLVGLNLVGLWPFL